MDDIIEQTRRVASKPGSPDTDGLDYPFFRLLYAFELLQPLIMEVYNQALTSGTFPTSWKDIRVCLLLKKSDLVSLKNLRSISLINCDAKIFTRLLNFRFAQVLPTLINPYQTGFMQEQFIGDNGMLMNLVLEHASSTKQDGIALLLDQEKANDRVHPVYLQRVLLRFNFPPSFVATPVSLFFGNNVRINVNGHFTSAIKQDCGHRQGDPLLPTLFNIALEPLLRYILHDRHMEGYSFVRREESQNMDILPALKVLAYADDVCVFIPSFSNFYRLQHHLSMYSNAFNARLSIHKTEAISLCRQLQQEWIDFLSGQQITQWHDCFASEPLRYLGFPLIQSPVQRIYLEN